MAMLGEVRTEEGTARVAAGREFIRAAECPEPGCAWQRFWSESSSLDGSAAWYRRTAGRTREDWVNPPADSVVSAVVVNAIDDMMHDAWYFSIATLPDTAKVGITQHLSSADVPPQYREEFDRIVDFMNTGASTDGFMLRMKIADLDRKRNQNMRDVAPEFADLIDYQ